MEFLFTPLMIVSATIGVLVMRARGKQFRIPWVTLAIALVTMVVGVLALFDPALLAAISRDRDALLAGEWWRIITPLFGQDSGGFGLIFNLAALLAFGTFIEVTFGWRMLLVTYFAAGLVSEAAAYTVLPDQGFAGNSVATVGLVGLLAVAAAAQPFPLRLFGGFVLLGGLALLIGGDLHGVGFAVGALVGVIYVLVGWAKTRPRRPASSVAPGASAESSAGS
jgi:rhomboid protease GluP